MQYICKQECFFAYVTACRPVFDLGSVVVYYVVLVVDVGVASQ